MTLMPSQVLYPGGSGAPDLVADVDWATGIVRMHIPYDKWRRLLDSDPADLAADDLHVLETITHEAMHVLQMVMTGYAYDLSRACFQQVATALQAEHDLDGVYRERARYTAALEPRFAALVEPGERGVRAVDILEGAAFLAQKRSHWEGLGPQSYERILDKHVDDAAYRRAYDVAVGILGEDAFDQFLHVATLALETRSPETVLVPLLEAFRAEASRLDLDHNHQVGLRLLNQEFRDLLLGHPLELREQGLIHPLLDPILLGYNDLAWQEDLSIVGLMAHPQSFGMQQAKLLVGPVLFPPVEGQPKPVAYIPTAWEERAGDEHLKDPVLLHLLSATSQLIVMDIEPTPAEPAGRVDAHAGYDMPVTIRNWVFTRENRIDATLDRFGELMGEIELKPARARMLRGTVVVSFPVEEHEDSPLLDPEVRRFLRGLYDRIPHLLYYLADAPAGAAMLACVAAHAPDDAVTATDDGGIGVAIDERVVIPLLACAQSAALAALRLGDDPHVLLGHFRALDSKLAVALTEVVLDPALADV
jgi:hypothetical protein